MEGKKETPSGNWTHVGEAKHIARAEAAIMVTYSQIYCKYIFQHGDKEMEVQKERERE